MGVLGLIAFVAGIITIFGPGERLIGTGLVLVGLFLLWKARQKLDLRQKDIEERLRSAGFTRTAEATHKLHKFWFDAQGKRLAIINGDWSHFSLLDYDKIDKWSVNSKPLGATQLYELAISTWMPEKPVVRVNFANDFDGANRVSQTMRIHLSGRG